MKWIINDHVILSPRPEGPLAAYISLFAEWLSEQGYALYSIYRSVLLAACFSGWLGQRAIRRQRVSSQNLVDYLRYRYRRVRPHREDKPSLMHFLDFLRCRGFIPAEKTRSPRMTPAEQCAKAFEQYLRQERGLATATIVNYVPLLRAIHPVLSQKLFWQRSSGPIPFGWQRCGELCPVSSAALACDASEAADHGTAFVPAIRTL